MKFSNVLLRAAGTAVLCLSLVSLSYAQSDMKSGIASKLGTDLAGLYAGSSGKSKASTSAGLRSNSGAASQLSAANPMIHSKGMVIVDAVAASDGAALLRDMQSMGLKNGKQRGLVVSGAFPVSALEDLANTASLQFVRPAAATTNRGLVTTQGDVAQGSDEVRREEELKGRGVTVGVLSDSYDCLGGAATDIATKDLPKANRINVLDDSACPASDEGRGMMQLIHDVAPAARQAFHTAFNGQADFADGIIELANAGNSDIIVDDIIYFREPMFQDGIIAQAVDTVKAQGVAYFSSAGNNARNAYESTFRPSGVLGVFGGERHDFDPGPGVDDLQTITLGTGSTTFSFQWDEPYASVSGAPGSASDVDIVLYLPGGIFIGLGGFAVNVGGDPIEVFGVFNSGPPVQVEIGIELFSGPAPSFMKYVYFDQGPTTVDEFATNSGTVYGHANAAGAEAVGAAAWFNTAAFNSNCVPACLNSFSSAGPTPILFDLAGNRIAPDIRLKPEIVGPDGGDTTFFGSDLSFPVPGTDEPNGFPNFFGTSASAPHVAGLAALILEEEDELTPDQLYRLLEATADDMDDPATAGFDTGADFGTGHGFVNAVRAVEEADDFEDDDDDDGDDDD